VRKGAGKQRREQISLLRQEGSELARRAKRKSKHKGLDWISFASLKMKDQYFNLGLITLVLSRFP